MTPSDVDYTAELSEFLLARIAEDEAVARSAYGHRVNTRTREPDQWRQGVGALALEVFGPSESVAETKGVAAAAHITRHDPARVLADCEAKRRLVEGLVRFMEGDYAPWNEGFLKIMATVYLDHPDYVRAWNA